MREAMLIDKNTGEYIRDENIFDWRDGTESKEEIEKRKSKDENKKWIEDNLGGFYFMFYKLINAGIERQFITRFIYLATYMNYENKLTIGNTKATRYLLESELQTILDISRTDTHRTKKSLLDNELITIDCDGVITVNDKHCIKGKIKGQKQKSDKVRIFEKGIREIYKASNTKEHKKLGVLFALLEYVHKDTNIICSNPKTDLIEEIKPLSLKWICTEIGYDPKKSFRLKNELLSITVSDEYVFSITGISNKELIKINPRIYSKVPLEEASEMIKSLMKDFIIANN